MANDVFQKFKSSVNRGITTISVKTSSSLEKTKIKTHIDSLTKEIEKCTYHIGEQAYAIWNSGKTDYSELNALFESIKQKQQEIEELTENLSTIDERDSQILGNVKNEYQAEQQEQPVAQTTVPTQAEVAPTANKGVFCSQCGTFYDAPVKFCRQCGNQMQK